MATETRAVTRYTVPTPFYLSLWTIHALRGAFRWAGSLESAMLRSQLRRRTIDRPIYISGVPRCGTTITLEMLSSHPSVITQRYADMLMPYLPYIWTLGTRLLSKIVPDEPQERIHQDRMQVTKLSPEGAEELLWLPYFANLHSETASCVLDKDATNPAFDRFYSDTIQKLMLVNKKSRYLSKANENVTRLLYLHRLFPSARFLLFIRHPAHHIASLMKQDRLFNRLAKDDPRIAPMTGFTGHFEFGPSKRWARISDDIGEIRRRYDRGEEAQAWALHWSAVYELVHKQLQENPTLAAATMVVRYEDLCRTPGETIDRILAHTELDAKDFAATREGYLKKLSEPTYYRPDYSPEDIRQIDEITGATRLKFGYAESTEQALGEIRKAG